MREGWKLEIFSSIEEADEADRLANLARTGRERIQILTAISTPNATRSERRLPGFYEILDGPER